MASVHGLGTVLVAGDHRYVVVGHRVTSDGVGAAVGYLTVPYPLGFVDSSSLAELAPAAVEAVVAEGYANADGAAYAAGLASLLGNAGAETPAAAAPEAKAAPAPEPGLLPVGSVVRLADADALVMVMGFEPELDDDQADYLGVVWPQGLVASDAALAFDADGVAEVVHCGLWDAEAQAGLDAVRRYRSAANDLRQQIESFVADLTPEAIRAYRAEYLFDHLEEEPEPDLFDELEDEPEPDFPDEGSLA